MGENRSELEALEQPMEQFGFPDRHTISGLSVPMFQQILSIRKNINNHSSTSENCVFTRIGEIGVPGTEMKKGIDWSVDRALQRGIQNPLYKAIERVECSCIGMGMFVYIRR